MHLRRFLSALRNTIYWNAVRSSNETRRSFESFVTSCRKKMKTNFNLLKVAVNGIMEKFPADMTKSLNEALLRQQLNERTFSSDLLAGGSIFVFLRAVCLSSSIAALWHGAGTRRQYSMYYWAVGRSFHLNREDQTAKLSFIATSCAIKEVLMWMFTKMFTQLCSFYRLCSLHSVAFMCCLMTEF